MWLGLLQMVQDGTSVTACTPQTFNTTLDHATYTIQWHDSAMVGSINEVTTRDYRVIVNDIVESCADCE